MIHLMIAEWMAREDPDFQAAADDGSVGSIAAHLLGIRGGANALVRVPLAWRDLRVPHHAAPHIDRHERALLRCPDGKVAHVHRLHVVEGKKLAADLSSLALKRAAKDSGDPNAADGPDWIPDRGWHSSVDLFAWQDEPAAAGISQAAAAAAITAFNAAVNGDGDGDGDGDVGGDERKGTKSGNGGDGKGGEDLLVSHPLDTTTDGGGGGGGGEAGAELKIRKDLTRSWFNVWPPGSGHPAHDHADASIAGVFYARVPQARRRGGFPPGPRRLVHLSNVLRTFNTFYVPSFMMKNKRAVFFYILETNAKLLILICNYFCLRSTCPFVQGARMRRDRGDAEGDGVHSAALVLSTAPPTAKRPGRNATAVVWDMSGPITCKDTGAEHKKYI